MSDIEDVFRYGVGGRVEKTVSIDANGVEHIKQVLHVQFDKCTTVFRHVQRGLISVRRAPKSARIHARRVKQAKRK